MMQTSVKKSLRVTVYDTVSFWAIAEIVPRNAPDLAVWVGATDYTSTPLRSSTGTDVWPMPWTVLFP
jgi:hypothetical protein